MTGAVGDCLALRAPRGRTKSCDNPFIDQRLRGASVAVAEQLQEFCGERRRDIVRFATLQLRDEALAEDVVQETLLTALQGSDVFSGRASVKT